MLLELKIRNVALIPELTLEWGPGLTVVTGETGAGKSILLGALSLLLGERASADLIRSGCESASVEALVAAEHLPAAAGLLEEHGLPACEDGMLIIKRELSRNGRGKSYINNSLTTLNVLERLGEELADLHGQHEHQSLLRRECQLDLIDAWGGLGKLRAQTGEAYAALRASREARERLALNEAERSRRLDLLSFQVSEIDQAGILPGEMEALAEEKGKLAHAERLITAVQEVLEVLHLRESTAVQDGLAGSADSLAEMAKYDSTMGGLADALRSAEAQVGEVVDRLNDFAGGFEADPARLDAVEERLDLLHKLQRKYGGTEETILNFRNQAAAELNSLAHQDEQLDCLAREEEKLTARLSELARRLSLARNGAGKQMSSLIEAELRELGFAQAVFEMRVAPREARDGWVAWDNKNFQCGPRGADEVEFMIAPNPGETAKPVAKTASGGELSRIMLALKVIAAGAASVPTMIFDEVDAGVGGVTADAVGRKLKALAQKRQVIVITHLPQIARFAEHHFRVVKDLEHGRTVTTVERLEGERRVEEMARLLAGEQVTETALLHAREMIGDESA